MFPLPVLLFASFLSVGAALNIFSASSPPQTLPSRSNKRAETQGCGIEHDWLGETREFSITSSGGERTYHVHLPYNYNPDEPTPLLIAYHGSETEPLDFETVTWFSDPLVNPDMITVYPAGVDLNWEGPSYANPAVSDLSFTSDLVDQLKDDYCIDPDRLYATGHSNGGGFVNTLACSEQHGSQFAGFASVSAALYTDVHGNEGCDSTKRVRPVFETHGTVDDVIPYEGGEGRGGPLPKVREWVGRWRKRNRCDWKPKKSQLASDVTDLNWSCHGKPGTLRHVVMKGWDHEYPSRNSTSLFISPRIIDWLTPLRHH